MSSRFPTVTEDTIGVLVETFYAKVRQDPALGPVFAAAIPDDRWPAHLAVIASFWSSVLLRTGRYKGNPFAAHMRLPDLRPALFERWLSLFGETCHALFEEEIAREIHARAMRIGESLQAGLFFRPDRSRVA